jgi:hypothetical protein
MNTARLMKLTTTLCLLLASIALDVRAASPADFPHLKALAAPPGASQAFGVLEADEELLAATDNGMANLRLFDAGNAEVPFLVRARQVTRSVVTEAEVPMRTLSLEAQAGNSIRVLLEQSEATEHSPSVLILESPLRDFEKQVLVEGSPDGNTWTTLGGPRPIFDYSRFMDVRNTRIEFAPGHCRHFRVFVSNITENAQSPLVEIARTTQEGRTFSETERSSFRRTDFRVDRLRFYEKRTTGVRAEPVLRDYTTSGFTVANDVKAKTTAVTFQSPRAPLTSITLAVGDRNFSRQCTVDVLSEGPGQPEWRFLARTQLTRVDAGEFQVDQLKLSLSGVQRHASYRLTLQNLDNPALNITGVRTEGVTLELVFLANRAQPYRLYYGGSGTPAPQYDIGAVLQRAETAAMDAYKADKQADNPAYSAGRARSPISGKTLLIGAVILMVGALAWAIAKASKKINLDENA